MRQCRYVKPCVSEGGCVRERVRGIKDQERPGASQKLLTDFLSLSLSPELVPLEGMDTGVQVVGYVR